MLGRRSGSPGQPNTCLVDNTKAIQEMDTINYYPGLKLERRFRIEDSSCESLQVVMSTSRLARLGELAKLALVRVYLASKSK